jgi:hypothetical protein
MRDLSEDEERAYKRVLRLAELGLTDLSKRLVEAVGALGDPYLVRARIAEPRIKSPSSLMRKAGLQGWKFLDALSRASDVIGLRLVCHNLEDVKRAADLLEINLSAAGFEVRCDNYSEQPKPSGYRAIHLTFSMPLRLGQDEAQIGCDRLLARADYTANKIRVDLVKPRRGRRPQAGQLLTAPSLAFLYRRRFGQDPPEYLIQAVLRDETLPLRTDGLEAALQDEAFITQLEKIYSAASDWKPDPAQIFRWAVHSLVVGKDAALRRAGRDGRLERQEIAAIAAREAIGGFSSLDDIAQSLEYAQKDEDPGSDIESWASALGVADRCVFCGTALVDPEELAAALVKHYKLRGHRAKAMRERLSEAIQSNAIETGSWGSSTLCSYCDHGLAKD